MLLLLSFLSCTQARGNTIENTYRSGEKFETALIEKKKAQFTYAEVSFAIAVDVYFLGSVLFSAYFTTLYIHTCILYLSIE